MTLLPSKGSVMSCMNNVVHRILRVARHGVFTYLRRPVNKQWARCHCGRGHGQYERQSRSDDDECSFDFLHLPRIFWILYPVELRTNLLRGTTRSPALRLGPARQYRLSGNANELQPAGPWLDGRSTRGSVFSRWRVQIRPLGGRLEHLTTPTDVNIRVLSKRLGLCAVPLTGSVWVRWRVLAFGYLFSGLVWIIHPVLSLAYAYSGTTAARDRPGRPL